MKFDQLSDFHVEHSKPNCDLPGWEEGDAFLYPWDKKKQSDILILNGDCSNSVKNTLLVVYEAAQYYENVLFTDGNHDHWCGSDDPSRYNVGNNMQAFRKFARETENVHFLDGESEFVQDGTLFIGACGWYDFKMIEGYTFHQQYINWKKNWPDALYSVFGKKKPQHLAYQHASLLSRQVLRAQEDDSIKEIVVTTHTVPHELGLIQDQTHPWYYSNGAFGNSLMRWVWEADFKHKIKVWTFGHTHFQYDFVDHGIRFLTNPRGYSSDKYKPRDVIQVDTEYGESAFGEVE